MTNKRSLWDLWMLRKTMGILPSKALNVQQNASRLLGLRDTITALAFDRAVMTWGLWVENKLHELDDDHKPMWTLKELLSDETAEQRNERVISQIEASPEMRKTVVYLN